MKTLRWTLPSWAIPGVLALGTSVGLAQTTPPPSGEIFPLAQVHAGLQATAWTVFEGTRPEPMNVEILGVLRGGRGPGQDMILARLHGTKPEYTGVVAGMSGSPVYVDGKLMGALAFRIGQFSKEPIAGITPIEEMLKVRNLPAVGAASRTENASGMNLQPMNLQPMDTPLTMSGFSPETIRFWQQSMQGTGLETVAAGGSSAAQPDAPAEVPVPGGAVSALLIRGDMQMAATCTVTYVDAKQLLACGHPLFQMGHAELPMTSTEVLATLPSPLNAFKIVNTGAVLGAFTEDRDSAIRGELGRTAHMIPMQVTVKSAESAERVVKVELLDQPAMTAQAATVVLMQSLVETLANTATASYHVQGVLRLAGMEPVPFDQWAVGSEQIPAPIAAAIQLGDRIQRLYSASTRQTSLERIELHVDTIPHHAITEIAGARLLGSSSVRAGERVEVEATLRPYQRPERRLRMSFQLPQGLQPGTLRLMLSDATLLDRAEGRSLEVSPMAAALVQQNRSTSVATQAADARARHAADHLYLTLLTPGAQTAVEGQTLSNLPLSIANTLEAQRGLQSSSLSGESAVPVAELPVGELVTGFEMISLHILPGAGLD